MKPELVSEERLDQLLAATYTKLRRDGSGVAIDRFSFLAGARAVLKELEQRALNIVDARGMSGIIELPLGSVLLPGMKDA